MTEGSDEDKWSFSDDWKLNRFARRVGYERPTQDAKALTVRKG